MRSRDGSSSRRPGFAGSADAWLAAIAAALGVSDVACSRDSTNAPAAVREVTSVALVDSVAAIETASAAPSAMDTASAAPSTVASGGVGGRHETPASCGAIGTIGHLNEIRNMPITQQACGAPAPRNVGPRAVIAAKVTGATGIDERVVGAARPRLRLCANKGLQNDPNETGKAVVTVVIGPNGDVTSSTLTSASGLAATTTACMAAVFRNVTFQNAAHSVVVTIVQTHEAP
jgi:hypothetical protein